MVAILSDDATERIGKFDMRVRCSERPGESEGRRRSDVLAAWLLEQWERRQCEIAERN